MIQKNIPVITIDGPSGTGKGTIGWLLAQRLQWHFLDSGALYRAFACAVMLSDNMDVNDENVLLELVKKIQITFISDPQNNSYRTNVLLSNENISAQIRSEECGKTASSLASNPHVRKALLQWQHDFASSPGLVTDGRDMGTVVFPNAKIKIFLFASAEERAERRYKQLKEQGINVNLDRILADLTERDERDMKRATAPLKPAEDAIWIDTTDLSINDVLHRILKLV